MLETYLNWRTWKCLSETGNSMLQELTAHCSPLKTFMLRPRTTFLHIATCWLSMQGACHLHVFLFVLSSMCGFIVATSGLFFLSFFALVAFVLCSSSVSRAFVLCRGLVLLYSAAAPCLELVFLLCSSSVSSAFMICSSSRTRRMHCSCGSLIWNIFLTTPGSQGKMVMSFAFESCTFFQSYFVSSGLGPFS